MYDVAIIGAGAAGMMCAGLAGQRGLRVVLIDHATKLAEKIRISGGGRCNFTNIGTQPSHFISENPAFCRSALAGYTPGDFLDLLREHGVSWHEKHRGQLFCDTSSDAIIDVLREECTRGRVSWRMPCTVESITREGTTFSLATSEGPIQAAALVIATGGMAIPQLGASDFGLKVARQFGLKVVEPRPALVPLTFAAPVWAPFVPLAGVALEASISTGEGQGRTEFLEDVLFTHRGLSGPGILQISSYWQPNTPISIDLAPGRDLTRELIDARRGNRQQLGTVLSAMWPKRLADVWLAQQEGVQGSETGGALGKPQGASAASAAARVTAAKALSASRAGPPLSAAGERAVAARASAARLAANRAQRQAAAVAAQGTRAGLASQRLADVPDRDLRTLGGAVHAWRLSPDGTQGYRKAEVMRGGVDTRQLDQRSMQARQVPGLHFIGEVVDVTGWLGGYNFQWAWASAAACARALAAAPARPA